MPNRRRFPKAKTRRPLPRWQRFPFAFTRALLTLLNEFRLPVITFLLVTLGGGYLYGELHRIAYERIADIVDGPFIPMIDRPYIMLQLMVIETPPMYSQPPDVWYLVAFWYLLPPIFVFIVGNGAADFVRLFFGDTWRKVRLANRENHVIVMGAGHVGLRVVRWLRAWDENVVVIDDHISEDKAKILQSLKAEYLQGDGRYQQALEDANIINAAAFIACTGEDTVNLYAMMRARALNPDIHVVARIWDDSFNNYIERYILNNERQSTAHAHDVYSALLSSSDLSAPIFAGLALGIELTQTFFVDDVGYAAVHLVVQAGSLLEGQTVGHIEQSNGADVVLYQEGVGSVEVRPDRDITVNAGDTLVIFALEQMCIDIAKNNQALTQQSGHVVVLGGGHVGLRVIRRLLAWGVRVVLIDNDMEPLVRDELENLHNTYGLLEIVEADGREKHALKDARIDSAMAFIACTGDDPINLYAIMRARAMNPDMQIVVRVWDDSFNQQIDDFILQSRTARTYQGSITSIRSSANLAAPIFAAVALGVDLTQTLLVHDFEHDREIRFAAIRLTVKASSYFDGRTVGDIQQQVYADKQRVDVVLHHRQGKAPVMPAEHRHVVRAGDTLIIFAQLHVCIAMAKRN
ncbi:MAG: NAD-binding protein [Anaerolineae bacterium]